MIHTKPISLIRLKTFAEESNENDYIKNRLNFSKQHVERNEIQAKWPV